MDKSKEQALEELTEYYEEKLQDKTGQLDQVLIEIVEIVKCVSIHTH